MAYLQITSEERYTIAALRREGYNQSEIALHLGRHRSTISREFGRNRCSGDGSYSPGRAIERTKVRRRRSRRNCRILEEDWSLVRTKLEEGWSPEQIAGRLGREGKLRISHESIYSYIWRDKRAGGSLHRCLRQSSKLRRKRRNSRDSRGRLPGKRHISERPTSATGRKTIGHWEVDTVLGSTKACIATLVERKTGYVLLGKLGDRRMRSMSRRLKFLIRRGSAGFETITADNGSEFHGYSSVECATGVEFYFATPYHSWERGSNENFNGLLREYLPKGEDLSLVTQRDCDALARIFNRRPRKRLGYRTPEECFHG